MTKKTKYSASRCGTFESCKLKFDLSYNRGYYAEETQQSVVTRKGNAFHYFAETYDPTWTDEQVLERRLQLEKDQEIPEEYSLEKPVARYVDFHKNFILKEIAEKGAQFHREIQFDFELDGNSFTGKLDILLQYPDGSFYIIDHKTGKSTNTSYYADQMALYVWALSKQYGVPEAELIDKVTVSIFFAFANPEEPNHLKALKTIKFTKEKLDAIRAQYTDMIQVIESKDWEPEASITRMCEWCSFCGFKQYCPDTAQAGLFPMRGVKILQKDWAKNAGIL